MTGCCWSVGLGGNLVRCAAMRDCCSWIRARWAAPTCCSPNSRSSRAVPGYTPVLNTHWHADQTGGNDVFGAAGAKLIAHAKAAQRMAADQYVPWEDRYIKARNKDAVPREVFYNGSRHCSSARSTSSTATCSSRIPMAISTCTLRESNVLLTGDSRVTAAGSGARLVRGRVAGWSRGFTGTAAWHRQRADAHHCRNRRRDLACRGQDRTRRHGDCIRPCVGDLPQGLHYRRHAEGQAAGWTAAYLADPDTFIYAAHKASGRTTTRFRTPSSESPCVPQGSC